MPKAKIQMYTDGSCLNNPGPGGWAALLRYNKTEKMFSGGQADTTNNQMELMAVIEGLKALTKPCAVELYTDSKYVMDGYTKWLPGWKTRSWKKSDKKPVLNKDLWVLLDEQAQSHKIDWHWVKAHNGHEENERVDQLARLQAEQTRDQNQ
ncbi:MAG: ribonuclease HI [Alcanivoracaceae bacterium]|nr:ribonuclease HI [Alcanivoracaceae bacterium]